MHYLHFQNYVDAAWNKVVRTVLQDCLTVFWQKQCRWDLMQIKPQSGGMWKPGTASAG
jgi:hypothetical protein